MKHEKGMTMSRYPKCGAEGTDDAKCCIECASSMPQTKHGKRGLPLSFSAIG